jgi:hypothetical protein
LRRYVAERDAGAVEGRAVLDERQAAVARGVAGRTLPLVAPLLAGRIERLQASLSRVCRPTKYSRALDLGAADGSAPARAHHGALLNVAPITARS